MDRYMRHYARALATVFSELDDLSVIDFGAGSGWIRKYPFASYLGLDRDPPDEPWAMRWDFNNALPEEHRRKFDVGVCLNAIQHAINPNQTLDHFLGALKAGGKLILAVPWLYPPADRDIDYWRIAPRALYRMTSPSFEKITLFFVGSMIDLPGRITSRWLSGGFRGFPPEQNARGHATPLCPADEGQIPTSFFGPLTTLILAENYLVPPAQ
jgi:SAM-dependent methyltransferase